MKQHAFWSALVWMLVLVVIVAPAASFSITDGEKITSRTGNTSPVIAITDTPIAEDGTITIDIAPLYGIVAGIEFNDANVIVDDTAAAATWTGVVEGETLTLTSIGGQTEVDETITVTFTGALGSPWLADTGGSEYTSTLQVSRPDTSDAGNITVAIETMLGPGGLLTAPGEAITASEGATTMEITITDAPVLQYDTIIIDLFELDLFAASSALTDANVVINDTAAAATWTGLIEWGSLTLTSTEGPTEVGETITVTFTGAGGNPWISETGGTQTVFLAPYRNDNSATAEWSFVIDIASLTGFTITDGEKIVTTTGTTSPVITITESDLPENGTITIDLSPIHAYVVGGSLTDANVVVNDTAEAATWMAAVDGNNLTLTSNGSPTIVGENVTVTLTGASGMPWIPNTHGEQTILLPVTRTDTLGSGTINFVIETAPPPGFTVAANFSALPVTEMAPLTVAFTDTSLGHPTSWNWDFGDGLTSEDQNPVHLYTDVGTYTVSLTVNNTYGSDTKTQWNYIHALNGGVREANTSINGLTITNCGGPQFVTVDTSILPATVVPNSSVLEIQPPADRGFNNITLYALDGFGFSQNGNLITGNITGVHLVTEDIAPSPGFSVDIGTNSSFNVSIDLSSYPCNAILSTKIWEGVIPEYDAKLQKITTGNNAVSIGTAYTAKITKVNFPSGTSVKLHMSVNSSWNPSLSGGPGDIFIWRIADDGNSGQVLPTSHLYTDPVGNLDYFAANSPQGMSTFGISSLTGNNNPFQLIAFIAQNYVNPPSNDGGDTGDGGGGDTPSVATTTPTPNSTVITPILTDLNITTAKIYTNADGIITQTTTLKSTDGLAQVALGLGTVALNSSGKPLESLSIRRIPAEELPAAPLKAALSFAGMVYDIQPDGATFSPFVSLSFTIPQTQWDKEFVLREYDHATDTWLDLPSSYDPQTGTITAQVTHLCKFALFTQSKTIEKAEIPKPTITVAKSPLSIDAGLYGWVLSLIMQNPIIIVIVFAALALTGYFRWWKRRL